MDGARHEQADGIDPFRCTVCGTAFSPRLMERPGRVCHCCGATRQSVELAAALLMTVGRGLHPSLTRLACEPAIDGVNVLDLSGDPALSDVMGIAECYSTGTLLSGLPEGHPHARLAPVDLSAPPVPSVDVLILRDALFCAEDLPQTFDVIANILALGGWVIVQEGFAWPLPELTQKLEEGTSQPQRAIAGGLKAQTRWVIGADTVDGLRGRGLYGEFYRPNLHLDPLYRSALLVAFKA